MDLSSETATLSSTNSSYSASNAFDRTNSTIASSNCVDNSAPILIVDLPQLTCVKVSSIWFFPWVYKLKV